MQNQPVILAVVRTTEIVIPFFFNKPVRRPLGNRSMGQNVNKWLLKRWIRDTNSTSNDDENVSSYVRIYRCYKTINLPIQYVYRC